MEILYYTLEPIYLFMSWITWEKNIFMIFK